MLFEEEDAPPFKTWIVKRLENTSDADADVLADYVLALLRHEGDVDSIRKLCEQEVVDFLKEDCAGFVDDVFKAVGLRSYLPPGHPRALLTAQQPRQLTAASTRPGYSASLNPNLPSFVPGSSGFPTNFSGPPGSRKRTFNDRGEDDGTWFDGADTLSDGRHGGKMRRGGRGAFNGGYSAGRGQFGGYKPASLPPFDPNNPFGSWMSQVQAISSMIPALAGMSDTFGNGGGNMLGRPNGQQSSRCHDFDTKGICARGQACPFDHGNESVFYPPASSEDYDPNDAIISPDAPALPPPMFPSFFGMPNLMEVQQGRGGRRSRTKMHTLPRSQFAAEGPVHDPSNTSIVVENIPEGNFTEEQVSDFFGQFGEIAEITMHAYRRLAIIRYATRDAANEAWSSPKVIFDNRFVKVYWYKGQVDMQARKNGGGSVNEDGGEGSQNSGGLEIDMEEFTRKQEEAQRQYEERMEKRAELDRKKEELEELQRELLAKQMEEKRRLQEKLAQNGDGSEHGGATKQDGNSSSATEALRAQLAALEEEAKTLGIDTNTLDDGQQSSTDYLRGGWEPGVRGRGAYRGRAPRGVMGYRGRGAHRGRGDIHMAYAAYSLDNRPKIVAISGVDFTVPEKYETLRHYLVGIGEFTSIRTAASTTYITFSDRKTAEMFMAVGRRIPDVDADLELAWSNEEEAANAGASLATKPPQQQINAPQDPKAGPGSKTSTIQTSADEGARPGAGDGQDVSHGDMDYDVADDNEWGA